jgi:hypothetical protein
VRPILWPTPILFFSLTAPSGRHSYSIVSARVRAGTRGARNRGRANEVQPRSRLMVPRAHLRRNGGVCPCWVFADRIRAKLCPVTRGRLASPAARVTRILPDLPRTVVSLSSGATPRAAARTGRHSSPVPITITAGIFRHCWRKACLAQITSLGVTRRSGCRPFPRW